MIRTFIFLFRYKILKDPKNLSYQTKEFFELSKKEQRQVVDKYFHKFGTDDNIAAYFQEVHARVYQENQEVTFFHCYYFDKLLITYNVYNIRFIDQFKLSAKKLNYLIHYLLEIIRENHIDFKVDNLFGYPDELPTTLSQSIEFMEYLVKKSCYNIKYITYNSEYPERQGELVRGVIQQLSQEKFDIQSFFKSDQVLPEFLVTNMDFLFYLIKNDLCNVKYLNEKILESQTIDNQKELVQTIILAMERQNLGINFIGENQALARILNHDEDFIHYIIHKDLGSIGYIDWHNLNSHALVRVIDDITACFRQTNQDFDIMTYPFRELFFQNYHFMQYLMQKDFRWIAVTRVNEVQENNQLVELFFKQVTANNYKFKLDNFLVDGKYINHRLIENKKMLHYFFVHRVPLIQHINFLQLKSTRTVVENIVSELEKARPEYEFHNEDYLIDGKYPTPFSNSYRFMRYVIDKNFNHIAYMDTSFLDKREKKRIINYAFRMVYYIRGDNKKLNFDLREAYFQNSDIIWDEYFQECLKSL